MSKQQAFGNILPSNTTQSTLAIENGQNEHRMLARTALQIIAGVKDPEQSNVSSLFKQIEFLDLEDAKAIMRMGCDTYSDSYNKYPTPYFWKCVKREVLRRKTAMSKSKIVPREKQSEEERLKVAEMARELSKTFEAKSKKDSEPNLLEKKFERYRGYIESDMVRVESQCAFFQQWIPRSQAEQMGVDIHCPKRWMESRTFGISKI